MKSLFLIISTDPLLIIKYKDLIDKMINLDNQKE
jgi:hypothetical protein